MDWDQALTRALGGGRTQKPTTRSEVERMQRALGSKRAVAERLGVSTRTVQRWAKGTNKPRPGHAAGLRELGRSRDVRSKLNPAKRRKLTTKGGRMRSQSEQGPRGPMGAASGWRDRTILVDVDAATMERVYEAWENGDDEEAAAILAEYMTDELGYPSSWDFGSPDDFRFN
jgi:DNA-binding transcriptional regulator YdaS (Cro superfamily)